MFDHGHASLVAAVSLVLLRIVPSAAQTTEPIPPNTINCEAFKKLPNGSWSVGAPTTFDLGPTKGTTLGGQVIMPNFFNIGGADLYTVLEKKCGSRRPI